MWPSSRPLFVRALALEACVLLAACFAGEGPTPPPAGGAGVRSRPLDAVYAPYVDGKLDGAGHPFGAQVLEGAGCAPDTGLVLADGVEARVGRDPEGYLCDAVTPLPLGLGPHTANVRLALLEGELTACGPDECGANVATVIVRAGDAVLAARELTELDFEVAGVLENVPVAFEVTGPGPVEVEVYWSGARSLVLAYAEVFRRSPRLVLEPASGVLAPDALFTIEALGPDPGGSFEVACGGEDLTAWLETLRGEGLVTEVTTDFRTVLSVPASLLFESCAALSPVVVRWQTADVAVREVREVHYLRERPPCVFDGTLGPAVLVTGFVQFPAGSSGQNVSGAAVARLDASRVGDARVMRLVLPVEFDAAAALVVDVAERCGVDAVVSFGRGGSDVVDLERVAVNRKDTSDVPWGFPDNRGVICDGAPLVLGAPESHVTRLPVERIQAALALEGIGSELSDDAGRYVCNSVFFTAAEALPADVLVGFVHLPYLPSPGEDDVAAMTRVVEVAVAETVSAVGG